MDQLFTQYRWRVTEAFHTLIWPYLFRAITVNEMNPIPLETVNELAAGSIGGAAQVLVGQPLDTIKTRAQIAPSEVDFPNCVAPGSY